MITQPLLDTLFDKAFSKRSYNIHFLFNPNLKHFKHVQKTSNSSQKTKDSKPILLLYAEHMGLLDKFGEGLRELIKSGEYADIFDCYFVSKQDWP